MGSSCKSIQFKKITKNMIRVHFAIQIINNRIHRFLRISDYKRSSMILRKQEMVKSDKEIWRSSISEWKRRRTCCRRRMERMSSWKIRMNLCFLCRNRGHSVKEKIRITKRIHPISCVLMLHTAVKMSKETRWVLGWYRIFLYRLSKAINSSNPQVSNLHNLEHKHLKNTSTPRRKKRQKTHTPTLFRSSKKNKSNQSISSRTTKTMISEVRNPAEGRTWSEW